MGLAWPGGMEGEGLCQSMGFISAHFLTITALRPLEDDERLRYLAAETIDILTHQKWQLASQRTWLAALCCWP